MSSIEGCINAYVYHRDSDEISLGSTYRNMLLELNKSCYKNSSSIYHTNPFGICSTQMHETVIADIKKYIYTISGRPCTIQYAMELGGGLNEPNYDEYPDSVFKTMWCLRTSMDQPEENLVSDPNFLHSDTRTYYVTVYAVAWLPNQIKDCITITPETTARCKPRFRFLVSV